MILSQLPNVGWLEQLPNRSPDFFWINLRSWADIALLSASSSNSQQVALDALKNIVDATKGTLENISLDSLVPDIFPDIPWGTIASLSAVALFLWLLR